MISVSGATGAQGKSVVNSLLDTSGFKVRALTRNLESSGAKSLQEKGCEVVKVDMNDSDSFLEKAIWFIWSICSHQLLGVPSRGIRKAEPQCR